MPSIAIDVRDFSFRIADKAILSDVSFSVGQGEFLTIVGPNGAGKSTLLRCIDRILLGGMGRIEVFGRPLAGYRQKELAQKVSYVPQADARAVPFTVEEFVLMGRYPYLSPFSSISREDRQIVRDTMDRTGIAQFAGRRLGTLSGGERQKVFIATALAQGAAVLLLDEPTTFLDYRHQAEIHELLARLNRQCGVTVLAVTHDLNRAVLESDRVLALRGGRVAFCGSPTELMKGEVLEAIYGTPLLLVDHPASAIPMIVPQPPER